MAAKKKHATRKQPPKVSATAKTINVDEALPKPPMDASLLDLMRQEFTLAEIEDAIEDYEGRKKRYNKRAERLIERMKAVSRGLAAVDAGLNALYLAKRERKGC